jgi:hypothetical protein
LRVWTLPSGIGINPSAELTINCPNKKHSIYGSHNKIDIINDISINFWHVRLQPFFAHEINGKYPIGTIIHYNNKPTGIIVKYISDGHIFNKSIIVNMFTLKQIAIGLDYYYTGLYYNIKMNEKKEIYVAEDWELYDNSLKTNDILLEINNVIVDRYMVYNKLSKEMCFDSWITCMFMEKDNEHLECKIIRNGIKMVVNILRKPLNDLMQIQYYSTDDSKITLDKIHTFNQIERFHKIGYELMKSPKKFFV